MDYAYLDENNVLIETDDSAFAYRQMEGRRKVRQTFMKGYCISTVFLPLNHGFGYGSVHFETYVFKADMDKNTITDFSEVWGDRHHTYDSAIRVHEKCVKELEEGTLLKKDEE